MPGFNVRIGVVGAQIEMSIEPLQGPLDGSEFVVPLDPISAGQIAEALVVAAREVLDHAV